MNRRQLLRFTASGLASGLLLPAQAEALSYLARNPVSILKPHEGSILSTIRPGDIIRIGCGRYEIVHEVLFDGTVIEVSNSLGADAEMRIMPWPEDSFEIAVR